MYAATASRRAPGADVGRSALHEGLLRREAWVWSERLSSEARLRGVQLSPHLAQSPPRQACGQRHAAPELRQGTGPHGRVRSDQSTPRHEGTQGCTASGRQPETSVRPRETTQNQGTASTSSLGERGRHLTDKDRQTSCREPSFQQAAP